MLCHRKHRIYTGLRGLVFAFLGFRYGGPYCLEHLHKKEKLKNKRSIKSSYTRRKIWGLKVTRPYSAVFDKPWTSAIERPFIRKKSLRLSLSTIKKEVF